MNLTIELPDGQDPERLAEELSLVRDRGDRLTLIEPGRRFWRRTRVTQWTPDKVTTSNGTYSFARLVGVGASHSRRHALQVAHG